MHGDCEGCKKPATYHLTEIEGGEKIEKHYCESCPLIAGEGAAMTSKAHTPINELLTNFVLAHSSGISTPAKETASECDACGITYADFKQGGLLGCERDYSTFEKELTPLISRAHEGATHHTGKTPNRKEGSGSGSGVGSGVGSMASEVKKKKVDIVKLKRELENAIKAEDYERAAKLRDQIRRAE
jgi:protein arginine kinase activator